MLVVASSLVSVACRAPGEPPARPAPGEYKDLIRRELDAAGSALQTSSLVLSYLDQDRVPGPYARVVLRQAANDLRKVSQDLAEVTPPPFAARAQRTFLAICLRDRERLEHVATGHDPPSIRERDRTQVLVAADGAVVENRLPAQLDPG